MRRGRGVATRRGELYGGRGLARGAPLAGAWLAAIAALAWGGHVGWAADPGAVDATSIRVAVAQNQAEVDLSIHGRYRIIEPSTATPLHDGRRLSKVTVRAAQDGIQVGEQVLPGGAVRIESSRDAAIHLNGQRLRGVVEIVRQHDQTLLVINRVSLGDYLRGVLSKEAPDYWPPEALKAIAIAARTYALYQRLSKPSLRYDVTGDVMSQVYGGKSGEKRRTNHAVEQTEGLILLFQGQLFPAFYHSTCGGRTEHGSVMGSAYGIAPLSGGVRCQFCAASPFFRWTRRLTAADVAWAIAKEGRASIWSVLDVRVSAASPTGRASSVAIQGSRAVTVTGYEFRRLFGFDRLRSTAFVIRRDGAGFLLDGHGWGHGVGLCQWGAAELARRGLSAKEILAFYYPSAQLALIGELPQPIRFIEGP